MSKYKSKYKDKQNILKKQKKKGKRKFNRFIKGKPLVKDRDKKFTSFLEGTDEKSDDVLEDFEKAYRLPKSKVF